MPNRIETATDTSTALDIDLILIEEGAANGEQSSLFDNNAATTERFRAVLLYFE